MKKVDALSRRPDHDNGKGDNDEKIVLRPEKFRVIEVKEDGLWKEVRGAVEAREEGWEEKDGVIFWKGRMYIPDSIVLREEIL